MFSEIVMVLNDKERAKSKYCPIIPVPPIVHILKLLYALCCLGYYYLRVWDVCATSMVLLCAKNVLVIRTK